MSQWRDDDGWAPQTWLALAVFAGFEPWLEALAAYAAWPEVEAYRGILGADVDFVPWRAKLPAGLDASDVEGSYIGRCVAGAVPTRPRHLHDLMNALTWARFPQAKRALCQGQIDVAMARGPQTNRLRTPLQDRLAMLDEGGLLVCAPRAHDSGVDDGVDSADGADGAEESVFGHGHLENAIVGRPSRGWPFFTASFADPDVTAAIVAYIESAVVDPVLTTGAPVSHTRST